MTVAAAAPPAVAVAAGTGPPVELCPDGGRVALDVVAPLAVILYQNKICEFKCTGEDTGYLDRGSIGYVRVKCTHKIFYHTPKLLVHTPN